jgi:Zn-dependent protease
MDQRTKTTLWIAAGAVVLIALVRDHHISTDQIIVFLVIVPSIILHEISHGYVANAFGDNTAKRAGRLTLNPVPHVDPVGTLIVPALLALGGFGLFGWAKPVPVNVGQLRHPRNQGVLVSLAGPATNVALACLGGAVFINFFRATVLQTGVFSVSARVAFYFSLVNIGLAAFNLIPIPPLDGSVVLERMLPARMWPGYLRLRQYTMPIILGLVLLNFYMHPGPLTWLLDHLYNWWAGVLGLPIVFG